MAIKKNLKQLVFEEYTYHFATINDKSTKSDNTTDSFTNKNEILNQVLENLKDNPLEKLINTEKVKRSALSFRYHDFFAFKISNPKNSIIHDETFNSHNILDYNYVNVLIYNKDDVQKILIERKSNVFANTKVVANILVRYIRSRLKNYGLTIKINPCFEKETFWNIISSHSAIKSVEFNYVKPNMANISKSINKVLRGSQESTKANEAKFHLKAGQNNYLHVSKDNEYIEGFVDYTSKGGGNIEVKVEGIRRKFKTTDVVKTQKLNLEHKDIEVNWISIKERILEFIDKFFK